MHFNRYSNLEGKHAFLSPSTSSWLRYDREQLLERIETSQAAALGSRKHAFACEAIKLGIKMPKTHTTINDYINDCIGFNLTPEQVLFYSDNCYGTADAIGLKKQPRDALPTLFIFDLKTGKTPAKSDQLMIYAALFCHEYGFKPTELLYDLRIYQNDEVIRFEVDPLYIISILDIIATSDRLINERNAEESL